ncbi:hypothetical protein WI44_00345 [Burkholderia cepacia]|nr:hypothetical protein WI44_00345 [Burkholderia cepacia]KVA42805.1 hypothetical protein WI45_16410 [Burkholderia cepacia]
MGNVETLILGDYELNESLYKKFCESVEGLIRQMLADRDIKCVDVDARVKTKGSLQRKITRKGEGKYKSIRDITDVCGVRIIVYFEDDVDRVSKLVESEFSIDKNNSVDKYDDLEPDQFGYRSVHHIISFDERRRDLPEYKAYADCKAELQVRSVLQHAWAEIEHDRGYKTSSEVPAVVKRRFSRLAGLLELADQEFMAIRDSLEAYSKSLPEKIESNPAVVMLDAESLVAYVNGDSRVADLDAYIGRLMGTEIVDAEVNAFDRRVSQLLFIGIDNIGKLQEIVKSQGDNVKQFADFWVDDVLKADGPALPIIRSLPRGTSLFYLIFVILLRYDTPDRWSTYAQEFMFDPVGVVEKMSRASSALKFR